MSFEVDPDVSRAGISIDTLIGSTEISTVQPDTIKPARPFDCYSIVVE